jgi:hypothetical protein
MSYLVRFLPDMKVLDICMSELKESNFVINPSEKRGILLGQKTCKNIFQPLHPVSLIHALKNYVMTHDDDSDDDDADNFAVFYLYFHPVN